MSVQRLPTAAIAPRMSLPPEIAFLLAEGIDAHLLTRAARDAAAAGTDAATALLNAGLMEETAYYRALARRLEDAELHLELRRVAPEGVERLANLVAVVAVGRARQVLDPRQRHQRRCFGRSLWTFARHALVASWLDLA